VTVVDRIEAQRSSLTPAERRVADVVLGRPQVVAFGTVAGVAAQAEASGATVVRLASKLGYDGFVGLQADVQEEMGDRLRPAAERIRRRPPSDLLGRALAAEVENVHATLEAVDPEMFDRAVARLADPAHQVAVLSGDATHGVAVLFADGLGMLRPGVQLVSGSETRVGRSLAHLERGDVVVALDLRRYERWVLAAAGAAKQRGAHLIALTDSRLSPLADVASETFVVCADGVGPFDSHVGTLAVANALVAGAAARLRESATRRLDRVERAWREADALVDP
jgi:DNA-binding MurR/RpiR family transcriptional regulator